LIAWFIFKEHFEKKIVYGMVLMTLVILNQIENYTKNGNNADNDKNLGIDNGI
jgi:hypothetical protein